LSFSILYRYLVFCRCPILQLIEIRILLPYLNSGSKFFKKSIKISYWILKSWIISCSKIYMGVCFQVVVVFIITKSLKCNLWFETDKVLFVYWIHIESCILSVYCLEVFFINSNFTIISILLFYSRMCRYYTA